MINLFWARYNAGAYLYVLFVLLSIATMLLGLAAQFVAGFLLMLWGFYICMSVFGFYKKQDVTVQSLDNPGSLPFHILKGIQDSYGHQGQDFLRKTLSRKGYILATLFILYVFVSLWSGIFPSYPEVFRVFQVQMETALGDDLAHYDPYLQLSLMVIGFLLINGFAFFFARLYVSLSTICTCALFVIFISVCLVVFANSNIDIPGVDITDLSFNGYGAGNYETVSVVIFGKNIPASSFEQRLAEGGVLGTVFLYSIGFYLALFLGSYVRKRDRWISACFGFLVLAVMVLVDLFLIKTPYHEAFWLSGWACLGGLWSSAIYQKKKKYTLHQI